MNQIINKIITVRLIKEWIRYNESITYKYNNKSIKYKND